MVGTPSFVGFPFPSSGDNPLPIPTAGLALWLDATRGLTLDGATSRVAAWASRVGTAVATQATTAAMPVVSTMNGLPSVAFDGADDTLVVTNPPTVGGGATTFLAFRLANTATYKTPLTGPGTAFKLTFHNDNNLRMAAADNSFDVGSGVPGDVASSVSTLLCTTYDRNGGSNGPWAFRLGRALRRSGTVSTPAFGAPTNRLGGTNGDAFGGLLSEILVYQRVLSAAEIAGVEGYLAAKWGTA